MNNLNTLVIKAKNGDKKAFDELYRLTQNDVWFTCISLIKNEDNAKDTMQNTYITAFLNLTNLNDTSKFTVWIKKIAVNKCRDFLKAKRDTPLDNEILENITEIDEVTVPDEYITDNENRKIILEIMKNTLSEVQYQTVVMYYFDEMSVSEIAKITDCPEGTVMSRLNLARAKMKKAITDYEKKNNDKLHAVVPVPFFVSVFNAESKNLSVPVINVDIPHTHAQGNAATSAENMISSGGKVMFQSTVSKIIAGVCAVAVVGGGITAAIIATNQNKQENISTNTSAGSTVSANSQESKSDAESTDGNNDADIAKIKYSLQDTVLFENEKCKVTAKNPEISGSGDDECLDFDIEVENKTSNEELRADAEEKFIYINGYSTTLLQKGQLKDRPFAQFLSWGVEPGKTNEISLKVYFKPLKEYGITSIDELAFRLYVYNKENDDDESKYYCNEMKYLYPTGLKKEDVKIPERIKTEKEKLIFDNEYAKVVYLNTEILKANEFHKEDYYTLNFYVENKTDKPFSCDLEVLVGKYNIEGSTRCNVEAGMRHYGCIRVDKEEYENICKSDKTELKVYIGEVGNTAHFEGLSSDKEWFKDSFAFKPE